MDLAYSRRRHRPDRRRNRRLLAAGDGPRFRLADGRLGDRQRRAADGGSAPAQSDAWPLVDALRRRDFRDLGRSADYLAATRRASLDLVDGGLRSVFWGRPPGAGLQTAAPQADPDLGPGIGGR